MGGLLPRLDEDPKLVLCRERISEETAEEVVEVETGLRLSKSSSRTSVQSRGSEDRHLSDCPDTELGD